MVLVEVVMVDKEGAHRQVKDTPISGHVTHVTHPWKSYHSGSTSCGGSRSEISSCH